MRAHNTGRVTYFGPSWTDAVLGIVSGGTNICIMCLDDESSGMMYLHTAANGTDTTTRARFTAPQMRELAARLIDAADHLEIRSAA